MKKYWKNLIKKWGIKAVRTSCHSVGFDWMTQSSIRFNSDFYDMIKVINKLKETKCRQTVKRLRHKTSSGITRFIITTKNQTLTTGSNVQHAMQSSRISNQLKMVFIDTNPNMMISWALISSTGMRWKKQELWSNMKQSMESWLITHKY